VLCHTTDFTTGQLESRSQKEVRLVNLAAARLPDREQTRREESTGGAEQCHCGKLRRRSPVAGQDESGIGESRDPEE